MNENEVKPYIDRLKKDPSLNEVLNFTGAILKKLPENEKAIDKIEAPKDNQMNAETLNSLVTAAQGFLNPTTLSLLSRTLNQSEIKEKDSDTTSLKHKVEQLSAELIEIKEELNQTKLQLREKNQRLVELKATVQSLKRRRRR